MPRPPKSARRFHEDRGKRPDVTPASRRIKRKETSAGKTEREASRADGTDSRPRASLYPALLVIYKARPARNAARVTKPRGMPLSARKGRDLEKANGLLLPRAQLCKAASAFRPRLSRRGTIETSPGIFIGKSRRGSPRLFFSFFGRRAPAARRESLSFGRRQLVVRRWAVSSWPDAPVGREYEGVTKCEPSRNRRPT